MGNNDMRFSDEQLADFHKQFQKHIELYNERVKTDDARHQSLLAVQEANAKQLTDLTKNTKDIVDLYADLKGTIRVGMAIQKFGLWCAKWGFISAMFAAVWKYIIKHGPPA